MNIFLDTSSLFKLYHKEAGTEELERLFINQKIAGVFLAEIAIIEFASVVWRKCRMKDIDSEKAKELFGEFFNAG
jgi:predicted nucleic acid-binding protein